MVSSILPVIDNGQIVGLYEDANGFNSFVFSGGVYTTFKVPGAASTTISGINNSGQIIGAYDDDDGVLRGFIATPDAVPEPASIALMGIGGIGMFGGWYRKRRKTTIAA